MSGEGKMNEQKWFGAKTIYRWAAGTPFVPSEKHTYEERVVLVRARDLDDALVQAKALAKEYATAIEAELTKYVSVYEMDDEIENGTELYSELRVSPLEPKAYVGKYYDNETNWPVDFKLKKDAEGRSQTDDSSP